MIPPVDHFQEAERLKKLESYSILDSLPEIDFDYLTSIASEICDTPISLISLIDNKRQWFKSHHGLNVTETPKEYAFCGHAINDQNNVLIVSDARKDERFHDNPLVTGDPNIVFYAGVPLISEEGLPLGTICVIDHKAKTLSENQIHSLKSLSNQVMRLIALRKKNQLLEQSIEQLKFENQQIEDFAHLAAHDLKEPLNTITSFIELLTDSNKGDLTDLEEKSYYFMNNASTRMKGVIKGLLDYSKLGKNEEISNVNFNTVIDSVIEDLDNLIKSKGAIIKVDLLPVIEAYPFEIRLLFQNLISNAIKYTKKGVTPRITISSKKLDNNWEFTVKDNGIGIDSANKEKVFKLFQVLHNKDEYDSTGIGLTHCKKIIELHNGTIWFDSQLGIGSEFHFTIHENLKIASFSNTKKISSHQKL